MGIGSARHIRSRRVWRPVPGSARLGTDAPTVVAAVSRPDPAGRPGPAAHFLTEGSATTSTFSLTACTCASIEIPLGHSYASERPHPQVGSLPPCLWTGDRIVAAGCKRAAMSTTPRSAVAIASSSELSLWWAEVLSEEDVPGYSVSMMWLDSSNHMLGRVLRLTDVPPRPTVGLARSLVRLHAQLMQASARTPGHLALALSRPGSVEVGEDDDEWADSLCVAFADLVEWTWSLHIAAGGWIAPRVDPPTSTFDPRRVPWRSPTLLLDRGWLLDQEPSHVAVPGLGQGTLRPGHRGGHRDA